MSLAHTLRNWRQWASLYSQKILLPPRVFSFQGESIGQILDNRDPATCPSLKNLQKKNCTELKELLLEVRSGVVARPAVHRRALTADPHAARNRR